MSFFVGMGISFLSEKKSENIKITPFNFKIEIRKVDGMQNGGRFICIENFKQCFLKNNISHTYKTFETPIFFFDSEIFTNNILGEIVPLDEKETRNDKASIIIDFYKNGSSTSFILKNEEGVFLFPAFFNNTKQFETIEDAIEYSHKGNTTLENSSNLL